MCDCYAHKCECCEELIPMHIGDFAYDRREFRVWCQKHIGEAPKHSVVFEITTLSIEDEDDGFYLGWKCSIYGPAVYGGGNHPNLGSDMMETWVDWEI